MNHRVQLFASGCTTLKFSGSWKTVTFSPASTPLVSPFASAGFWSRVGPDAAGATAAMVMGKDADVFYAVVAEFEAKACFSSATLSR